MCEIEFAFILGGRKRIFQGYMHGCTKKMGLVGCISHNISNNVARVHREELLVTDHELIYQKHQNN